MQVETEAITLARTASGVRVLLNTGDHVPMSRDDTVCLMRIVGSRGIIEYGAFEDDYVIVSPTHDRERVTVAPFEVSGHQRHLEHLADQIENGTRDYRVPESSLQALEIVEAAYLSKRLGTAIRLPVAGPQADPGADWDPGRPYSGVGGGRNGREL
jgi:predicted dehydrogenase